ncbi:pathogenesis-related family 1 protein [Lusitaniella coriacea]|nr:pathogenesis-related family 1 protein [Lusitaniella coriacea]
MLEKLTASFAVLGLGLVLTPLACAQNPTLLPLINSRPSTLVTQQPTFSLDGKPVYVLRDGEWREARLMGWNWSRHGGERYKVLYLEDNRIEQSVARDRVRSLKESQQAGIATNVYDLSSSTGVEQMLAAHNQLRANVNVAPLRWSPQLASYAQEWAEKLLREDKFEHRSNSSYGENLAFAGGQQFSPQRVVEMWGSEARDYNYATNRCATGKVCGHYTQIVWQNTTEVGCGMARGNNKEIWVCNYNPPGNFRGQKPY